MTTTMGELLGAAAEQAVPVLRGISDDRLDDPTPCAEYEVRALADHLLQVVINFQALAEKKPADFGSVPRFVDEDPAGWRDRFARETARLAEVWAAPGAEEGTAGQLGLPARTVGFMVLGDLTVHAWDLARATGQDFTPDPAVVAELAPALAAMAPMARENGVYGEPVEVGADATAFDHILAVTGRDPSWRPA
ncbi:TIGR03086 family metal-binding protein [Streptomyces sp. NPDC051018]|uniref:TIGR03086 family metal-binding protein n=1 Tax=Streptomyces sp. NPDC051018 TaxID=3365639 RepID=UPI00378D20D3